MIGRADIEGSKSNVAMNAWLPQASYPCGNFSDTSSFEFRRSKGSLGHAFTVRIRTGNQNQTSFYPSVPHEISVLVELILGHLRYLLTDVPPYIICSQNVAQIWAKYIDIGVQIPLVHTSSELAVRRAGKAPEGTVPSPSPDLHATTRSHRGSSSSSPPTADVFGTGTPGPSPQSQSFSRSYGSILPTSLAYIVPSTRGCSPWRPDAVMSTTGCGRHSVLRIFKGRRERTGHQGGAVPAAGPCLRLNRFQGGKAVKQKR
ncbi:Regulator of rDNA transcription protein 15 [Capsicum baccatum]|uniref:Regulator of rDNA transcription protein 15 n=1 Tax=Capsicum baccatum TaxID=33114 RepID=A0A2G2V197_CAPBA|nr:Regulator of rDNA transcription protein 15 [Capsicum baccatum]